jgi:hypothetical protein
VEERRRPRAWGEAWTRDLHAEMNGDGKIDLRENNIGRREDWETYASDLPI